MDFTIMDLNTVGHGKTGGSVRYLELFLKEYTAIFKEKVNPGCNRCLDTYLTKYKNHIKQMANKCKYRLHAKYENIPLEFGSPILVNNSNITDEYAQILLQKPNGRRYFDMIPEPKTVVTAGAIKKMKKVRIRTKRSTGSDTISDDATT
ncbi:hypothetical protein LRS05_13470 [Flavobacterium sp. J372]|uniref:hypothetical protein n=1 Tax=Flavobacterium sp. J372 TaxID=2898436 RepID=UPI00215148B8|nr:hypothetical protein [Flavobacterium sp. J372]MCR5863074.1 hypothetical protein [Flavobacterium sp. J372]